MRVIISPLLAITPTGAGCTGWRAPGGEDRGGRSSVDDHEGEEEGEEEDGGEDGAGEEGVEGFGAGGGRCGGRGGFGGHY